MLAAVGLVTGVLFATILALLGLAHGQQIELKGGKSLEFFDHLQVGEHWGVQYQIVEGTIGFRLLSPDGVIFEGPNETYGSYALTGKTAGLYSFEFKNTDPAGSPPKRISFSIIGSTNEQGILSLPLSWLV